MEKELNVLLSDLVVFSHKIQSFHWYIKGISFFQSHLKLEKLYDEASEHADLVAEAMLMCNLHPYSRLEDFMKTTKIKESKGDYIEVSEAYKTLFEDYKYLLDSVKNVKSLADKENNYLISTKMDDLITAYSKTIWMLTQTIMK